MEDSNMKEKNANEIDSKKWGEWGQKKELFKKTGSTEKKVKSKALAMHKLGSGVSHVSGKSYSHEKEALNKKRQGSRE